MVRLSPRQLQTLAGFICGGRDGPFEYRTGDQLDSFFRFSGVTIPEDISGSRFKWTLAVLEYLNANSAPGSSALPADVEQTLIALLDAREFSGDDVHAAAVSAVEGALRGTPVKINVGRDRSVSVQSARLTRGQRVLDEQIHTRFGATLAESDLHAARVHYAKAKRFLESGAPDYENSCKESICSIEAIATALTGEKDLPRAIKQATAIGALSRPLDDVVLKLYSYRGNEPGVAHGQAEAPSVGREEAELLLNLAGSIAKYLKEKLQA